MSLQENNIGWLAQTSAIFIFDDDYESLGKGLENEASYMGKKLTTSKIVPEKLCRAPQCSDFYTDPPS